MKLSKAAKIWIDYHKTHSKKNTVRAYRAIIERYIKEFGDGSVNQVTPEQILTFLNRLTEGNKPYTKRIRFSQLSSFFNFVRNNIDPELMNPCVSSLGVGEIDPPINVPDPAPLTLHNITLLIP